MVELMQASKTQIRIKAVIADPAVLLGCSALPDAIEPKISGSYQYMGYGVQQIYHKDI